MSPRAQVAVLVVAAILAGAGVGALVVTLTGSAGDSTTTRILTTTVSPSTSGGAAGTTTATAPPAANPPVAEAVADVKAKGYAVADTGTYDPEQRLSVLIGVLKGSADGTAQKAFFFADGRLIGTDTADVSANVQVATQSADEIGLRYSLYKGKDPQCCPTDGAVIVDYSWDGTSLKPLQAIPPSSISADGSRR
jgi:LppP/LprE lipoprotein